MLGKLIKYELKATSRWFLPIYILALLLAPLERFTINYMEEGLHLNPPLDRITSTVFFVITFAFVIVLIAIGMASTLLIIYRFYKNLITNEGYLMHTLPVKTSQLIWSKAIAGIFWTLASGLVICLAIFFLVVGTPGWSEFIKMISELFSLFIREYGANLSTWKFILEFLLMTVAGSVCYIFMIFAAIALGQLITKHKILGAFGAYFLINTALQTLFSLGFLPLFAKLGATTDFYTVEDVIGASLNIFFPAVILCLAAVSAAFYFITSYIFQNKLNLE